MSYSMPAKRGVLYVKWGNRLDALLRRSIDSVARFHPELPIHVHEFPPDSDILAKCSIFERSPFEETLFLDCDTVVLARLEFGFEMSQRHGLACCISECPWARRYAALKDASDVVEYNTGVLFFSAKAKAVFDLWKQSAGEIDSTARFYVGDQIHEGHNDQAGFAYAIRQLDVVPFVLPPNYNLRPMWQRGFFGPVKVWHSYDAVPPSVCQFSIEQDRRDAIIRYAVLG
jgi:hypothetical protein